MSSSTEIFTFFQEQNISNKYVNSIQDWYNKKGEITEKQVSLLKDIYKNYKFIKMLFENFNQEQIDDNYFIKSLYTQFNKTGSLSKKQIQCLEKAVSKL